MSSTSDQNVIERSGTPSAEFRHFIYDPEGDGFIYYRSAADRDADAVNVIAQYRDEGWSECVENIIAGEVTHTCEQTNVRQRPDDEDLDDNCCDGEGTYWGEFDAMCDYKLVPVAAERERAQ